MKLAILILAFCVTLVSTVEAKQVNYKAISEFEDLSAPLFTHPKRGLKDCLAQNKGPCVDVTKKNIAYHEVKDVEVDDYNMANAVFAAEEQNTPCADKNACLALMATRVKVAHPQAGEDIPDSNPVQQYPAEVSQYFCTMFGYYPVVPPEYDRVYCTKFIRWGKKTVKQVVENATEKAAYVANQVALRQDAKDKRVKRKARLKSLRNCTKNFGSLDAAAKDSCIQLVLKEVAKDELKASEM